MNKMLCIFGAGGQGRETLVTIRDVFDTKNIKLETNVCFLVDDSFHVDQQVMGIDVIKFSDFDPNKHTVVVAVSNPLHRESIVSKFPPETEFSTIIHPTCVIGMEVIIGEGTVVMPFTQLTHNIKIGKHAHINNNSNIGHDSCIGDYFTIASGVRISGHNNIGHRVYFGQNSCTKQKISICDDVTVGLGAGVISNIQEPGTYIGLPASKMRKS
ncbi:MAG: hypothetical protein K9J17_04405 [Flavobacteriales bacterium]|nr:hypothetical protein [Flavobacteriales bacterium]